MNTLIITEAELIIKGDATVQLRISAVLLRKPGRWDAPYAGVIRKLAAYVVLGMNEDGMKEVLSIVVGENESSKYWLSVLNSLKNRGVQDILILCSDGLTGIKDAISTAFPKTEQQRCIVHMVRNTLKYVANKDMKAFAKDLKTIIPLQMKKPQESS